MIKNKLIIASCLLLFIAGILFSIIKLNLPSVLSSMTHSGKSVVKNEGKEFNIIALGDSLSYGVGDAGNSGYIGKVEERLENHMKSEITVKDYGVPDDTSALLLKRLKNEQLQSSIGSAHMIFLNIGMNDYLNSLILTKTQPDRKKVIMMKAQLNYQNNVKKALTEMRKENPKAKIYLVGIYNPFPNRKDRLPESSLVQQWNKRAEKITAEQKNVRFINVEGVFTGKNKKDYFADEVHPNKNGYTLISDEVYKHLELS
ncbi:MULTISPECIES: GDSL-type esterase/lipase family protein [Fictibacillus]|uniref:GDSL-type esterase/lipase family protein n=1 Tax=Fictibacillus terranigra TaxID=3058424 RepID=A0ABT8E2U1_9BACL|nr:GDSL-type esterase/lipase family protein [Fictibacillus sp. CENA-BCM004]MDN4072228.1 GDSL-type esterase/lipase family protein [Fictibacillus sp. CENA-BCM004]